MQLITNQIKKKLPKLYETDGVPSEDKVVVCKFFNPMGRGTWYVVEGEERDGDFVFYGLIDFKFQEWGYFKLSDLSEIELPYRMKIERDKSFKPEKVEKYLN